MMNHARQGTKKFRGLIHIHTTFSYDGTLSLRDVVTLAKDKGYDFVILTEHAEDFYDNKMQLLVNDCIQASDESFLVIPGLEFNINNNIHILGIGIEEYINEGDPEVLIKKIHENNGLAILAHTIVCKNIPFTKLKDIDFIEIWNPRYGERLSPSIKSIKNLHEFRNMKNTYYASGGLDLHTIRDMAPLYQVVFSAQLNQKEILNALKWGEFTTKKGFIKLPSLNDPEGIMTGLIYLCAFLQWIPNGGKRIIRKIYKILKFRR
jgi:hypothetical protein